MTEITKKTWPLITFVVTFLNVLKFCKVKHLYVFTHIYISVYIYMYIYVCVYTHTHTHTHIYIYEVKWKWLSCDSFRPHGLYSPWNSPGQNTGVGSLSLLQGIFPTQGSNPGLQHCRQIFTSWATREAHIYVYVCVCMCVYIYISPNNQMLLWLCM